MNRNIKVSQRFNFMILFVHFGIFRFKNSALYFLS